MKEFKLGELVGRVKTPIKFDGLELKGSYGADVKIKDDVAVITKLTKYNDSLLCAQLYFKNINRIDYLYLNKDTAVKIPERPTAESILASYNNYLMKNLHASLGYPWFIGADPEMFITDENNQVIPAFKFLNSKDNPNYTYEGNYGKQTMYWDGYQAEFNVYPNQCLGWVADSIHCGIKGLYNAAKKYNPNAKLSIQTTMQVPFEELQTAKDEHIQFGCMPSFNAYGMEGIKLSGREVSLRTAGGHLHFGIGQDYNEMAIKNMVKSLDAILGIACTSLFAGYEDPYRRMMYGLAGEYRLPKHGLEYRTLSNVWLSHPVLTNMVFDLGRRALMFGMKGLNDQWKADEQEVIRIINTCDIGGARKILKDNEQLFKQILKTILNYSDVINEMYNIYINGMDTLIKNPHDIEGNWNLNGTWINHCDGKNKNVFKSFEAIKKGEKI